MPQYKVCQASQAVLGVLNSKRRAGEQVASEDERERVERCEAQAKRKRSARAKCVFEDSPHGPGGD